METWIRNVGTLVNGRIGEPVVTSTSITVEDGRISALGEEPARPDMVIDANGLTAIPGLIDSHVHPAFGDWTPAQNSLGWIGNYLHGGTTSMVSAGELHIPGLALDDLRPSTVLDLAALSRATTARAGIAGVKLLCGTLLLVQGLTEGDFDRMAEAGVRNAKFIFYDWSKAPSGEAQDYVAWAHERGITVKMHSGGVSRSGSSQVTGYEVIAAVEPDIVAHISGGPIPMPDEEIAEVVEAIGEITVEVCSSMNYRATTIAVDRLRALGRLDRLILGTDTPGGTGVIPRGMLRNICFLAGICGMDPVDAIAAATGNVAKAHGLDAGLLEVGRPADIVLLGPVQGSMAGDGCESFARGDLPGIGAVLVDGVPRVFPRSRQTPPPRSQVSLQHTGRPA